jgi:hemin uptake protein HemP
MIVTPIEPAPRNAACPVDGHAPRLIPSRAILGSARKILIEHEGSVYTLQLTRQGKLLLTK